jgi:Tfp pilus assembly protein PilE
MLLRISLIVAILAGLGAAAYTQLTVSTKVTEVIAARDDFKNNMEKAQADAATQKKNLKALNEKYDSTTKLLHQVTNELADVTQKAEQQEKRATDLSAQLEKALKEGNSARNELAAYDVLGYKPDQIKKLIVDYKQTQQERDAFIGENEVLLRNNRKLSSELSNYLDPNAAVVMKSGLKGKIVAVDPKWNFVVLNIGAEQGALERGEMLVNRNGKLVAKIRITGVEANRSIANVMPEWRWSDIMEGDQVLY